MSYQIADFQGQLLLIGKKNRLYPNLVAETNAIIAGLNADTTTHDRTLQLHPAPVRIGADKTPFTNEVLHLINRGKGGNLANSAMATVIGNAINSILPPTNTVAPQLTVLSGGGAVGSVLTCTVGTWQPAGVANARQWLRNGANIVGQTAASYTAVLADVGTNVSCRVTGTNANGSASAVSNAAAITALGG